MATPLSLSTGVSRASSRTSREARGGGAARARLERVRQARVQRRTVRPHSGGPRGDRARGPGAESVPGWGRFSCPNDARRAPRSRVSRTSRSPRGRRRDHVPLARVARPGDEIVCGWPSFPSYVLDAMKLGAWRRSGSALRGPPLRRGTRSSARSAPHEDRLPLQPEQPNRHDGRRGARSRPTSSGFPSTCSPVLDEAYFEYVESDDYPTGSRSPVKAGRRRSSCARSRRSTGCRACAVGYGVGPDEVVEAISKVRNAFDINQTAQTQRARASGTRRSRAAAAGDRRRSEASARTHAPRSAHVAVLRSRTSSSSRPGGLRAVFDRLLREGAIVRPLGPFGAGRLRSASRRHARTRTSSSRPRSSAVLQRARTSLGTYRPGPLLRFGP
jgi:hypothetical protein